MSNLTATRNRLFGTPAPRPRVTKPFDHLTKAALWTEVERLRAQLAAVDRVATVGRNSIQALGSEGTPAFRLLTDARAVLREVCALAERKDGLK